MRDWILDLLVNIADEEDQQAADGAGVGITLSVGGMMISGQLISAKLYLQMFGEGRLYDIIDEHAKGENSIDAVLTNPGPNESPEFIHLASAKFWCGANHPIPASGPGVVWRGRLASVDGFHLGQFQIRKPEDEA